MLEHRYSKRAKAHKRIRLTTDGTQFVDGTIRDMNRYGVFVETTTKLARNTGVVVEIDDVCPEDELGCRLSMMVVHSNRNGAGLVIDKQDIDGLAQLRHLTG